MASRFVTDCDHCGTDCTLDHLEVTRTGEGMTLGAPMVIGNDRVTFCSPEHLILFFKARIKE